MPAPAVIVNTATSPPPRSSPTDTGPAFLAGIFATGPTSLVTEDDAVTSLTQWINRYGGGSAAQARLPYAVEYDWVETYFRNGGNRLYCSRVVGDTPVYATLNLAGTSGTTLIANATEYGAFFNSFYKVSVTNGSDGSHRYVKLCAGASHPSTVNTVLATSLDATSRDDLVGQVLTDPVLGFSVSIAVGNGSGLPTVAAAATLASGADDHATADDANVTAALARFPMELGPGQVAAPNVLFAGASASQLALLTHAASTNRFAVCDSTDIASTGKGTLITLGGTLQGTANGSYGCLYTPYVTVQPYAAGGEDRRVPASALVCARLAAVDAQFHPNRAAAGIKDNAGVARWATGVGATFSRTPQGTSDADNLSDAGVNLIINRRGQVVVYDDITLVDPGGAEDNYLHIPNARYRMWTVARATGIGEGAQFDQINWDTISEFEFALNGLLKDDFSRGILVPETRGGPFSEAANVDTETVNDEDTMAAGEMNAALSVRPARSARFINITITAVSMTDSVS